MCVCVCVYSVCVWIYLYAYVHTYIYIYIYSSYVSQIGIAFDQLTNIKEYRTPQVGDVFKCQSRIVLCFPNV